MWRLRRLQSAILGKSDGFNAFQWELWWSRLHTIRKTQTNHRSAMSCHHFYGFCQQELPAADLVTRGMQKSFHCSFV